MAKFPPKWTDVYQGDEEQKFFVYLARGDFIWRSVYSISRSTGLDEAEVESLINKYLKINVIIKHPDDDDQWAYWQRVSNIDKLLDKNSITEDNHSKRVKNNLG